MSKKMCGNLCLLLAALVWGIAFVAQSAGMDYVGPFTFNSLRSLLGGIALIPVVLVMRPKDMSIRESIKTKRFKTTLIAGTVSGLVYCVAASFQQFGVSMTTAGKAGFITALYLIIVPLLGVFIHKKIPKITWLCVAIALVGFYLLSIHDGFTLETGDLLVLICAFMFSVHIIVIDHYTALDVNCTLMSCVQFIVGGLVMLICMFIFEKPTLQGIMGAKITILYAGVISCAIGYTMQIIGQKYTESTTASLLMSLESVFAAISGWLILGESMTPREMLGCALVFAAVLLAQIPIPQFKHK